MKRSRTNHNNTTIAGKSAPELVEPEICALLRQSSVEEVAKQYSLFFARHDGLILFCYDSIKAPHLLLTSQCRGLILIEETWQPVCWPMDRFYDHDDKTMSKDHSKEDSLQLHGAVRLEEKVDGTLVHLFYSPIHQKWMAATRHTFCDQYPLKQDILLQSMRLQHPNDIIETLADVVGLGCLDPNITYCLEVCSLQNRVIRKYPQPVTYLLAAFVTATHQALTDSELDQLQTVFQRPKLYNNNNSHDSENKDNSADTEMTLATLHPEAVLQACCEQEFLFEGLVLKDCHGNRKKFKSPLFDAIHMFVYRGFSYASPNHCIPVLLRYPPGILQQFYDALDELRPDEYEEIRWRFDAYETIMNEHWQQLEQLWWDKIERETERRQIFEHCRDSGLPLADVFFLKDGRTLRQWLAEQDDKNQHQSEKPLQFLKQFIFESAPKYDRAILKRLFGDYVNDPNHFVLSSLNHHDPTYCMPTEPPTERGVAETLPYRDETTTAGMEETTTMAGWYVACPCGSRMQLVRRHRDRNRYRLCHCGVKIGVHTYADGFLLWQCPTCESDHEAHQNDGSYSDGKVFVAGQPLGLPATAPVKRLRLHVHQLLDRIVGDANNPQLNNSREGYEFLANGLGLERKKTHMSLMDALQCYEALQLLSAIA